MIFNEFIKYFKENSFGLLFLQIREKGGEVIRGSEELLKMQYDFAMEYIVCGDARKAAEKAGYKQCHKNANRILRGENVQKIIKSELKKINKTCDDIRPLEKTDVYEIYKTDKQYERRIADAKEVIEYLTEVMRGEHGNDGEFWKVSEKDRLKAAELLGKRYGLFKEKVEEKADLPIIISGEGKLE